jgi:pimeloyl-ACP methyl ester carboxylesterase
VGRFTPSSLPVLPYDLAVATNPYDEFSLFHENLREWGLDVAIPKVSRVSFDVATGRVMSALKWFDEKPTLAMVHGGAQNAHTFDTVALAMQRPLISFDLPDHGHSDPSPYGVSPVKAYADDLAVAMAQAFDQPVPLVGMSLGGLVSLTLTHDHPELVSSLTLIDITPGVNADKAKHIHNFVNGPRSFDDFDALLARTVEHNPTRTVSSLRRGILHNALQRDDGRWIWRHQRFARNDVAGPDAGNLWDRLGEITVPVTLLRGVASGSVVDDDDEAEFLRRQPHGRVVHVQGAGHSIQGDAPLQMAQLLTQYC